MSEQALVSACSLLSNVSLGPGSLGDVSTVAIGDVPLGGSQRSRPSVSQRDPIGSVISEMVSSQNHVTY